MKIKIYDTQCGAKIFSKKVCEKIFEEKFISQWLFDVELFARLISVYGIDKTIEISFEQPVRKWIDIDESKINPIYFLKAPFEFLKIVRHYKLR